LQRAENARDYLVETHGIEASRIEARGAGSAEPIAGNDTPEGQLRNRRVEIRVTLPGGQ
jgi:peptidoglycan-binding protein ArfA